MGIVLLICLGLLAVAGTASGSDSSVYSRMFEQVQMERLARVQQQDRIKPFTTDGCSGGLSQGWRALSAAIPLFENKFGARPPYEACCVAHDKHYWQGQSQSGYEARLAADVELKQCVVETGEGMKSTLAMEFGLPEAVIENNFRIISELMYQAVRVGGLPCSYLPWRWGYGWEHCPLFESD